MISKNIAVTIIHHHRFAAYSFFIDHYNCTLKVSLTIKRTSTNNPDFHYLISLLDHELWVELKEDQSTYDQYNKVQDISTAIVVYDSEKPVACGCFKEYDTKTVEIKIQNFRTGNRFYFYTLTGGNDNGEFSRKVFVNGRGPEYISGGPSGYATLKAYSSLTTNGIRVTVPGRAAVFIAIDKK